MATPVSNSVPLTGNNLIDGLLQGSSWTFSGPHALTYSFSLNDTPGNQPAWSGALMTAVTQALAAWSAVANVTFTETGSGTIFTSSPADLAMALTGSELQQGGATALGLFPSPDFVNGLLPSVDYTRTTYPNGEGDIFFDNNYGGFNYLNPGGYGLATIIHEIGHAVGLKHTDDDGANGRPTFAALGISDHDSERWTVMSDKWGVGLNSGHAATPMPLDILAVQRIYGANTSYHTGDDTYTITSDLQSSSTIWDAGGDDTFDASGYQTALAATGVTIDLRPGVGYFLANASGSTPSASTTFTAIAFNTIIENVSGSPYNDVLIGNDANNVIDGKAGSDRMSGGAGDDRYIIDNGGDKVTEDAGAGTDAIQTSVTYTLPANVENLTLTGSGIINGAGNELANRITGNTAANTLTGGAGNDYIDGGAGFDVMAGGAGDDTYIVDSYTPPPPVTYFSLQGDPGNFLLDGTSVTATPSTGTFAISLLDDKADGVVDGLRIDYSSGATEYHMVYSLHTFSRVDYALKPGAWSAAYLYSADATSPDLPSMAVYGATQTATTGLGQFYIYDLQIDNSSGTPQLVQLQSDYNFYKNQTGAAVHGSLNYNYPASAQVETVTEDPNAGIDTVLASVSYSLPSNVENLTLTGTSAIDGTGNDEANVITGNRGNNVLSGGGGDDLIMPDAGNDTVDGGAGTDTVMFNAARAGYTMTGTIGNSMTIAHATQGTDTLASVEALVFTDVQHGGTFRNGGETKYADINADGRADMIFQGEDNTFWLSLSNGNGYDPAVRTVQHGGTYRNGGETHYADVNGDGKADLIFEGPDNTFWLSITNTDGLTNAVRSVQHGGNYRNGAEAQFADINGDGKADLIFQGEDNTFWLSISDSNGLTNAVRSVQHGGTYRNGHETNYADVNGDGRADMVFQGEDNTYWLSITDSTGLTNAVRTVQHGGAFRNGGETHLADVNGDGKADLIFQAPDNMFWLSLSTGTGFTNAVSTVQHGGAYRDGSEVHFVDVTGDGEADMIFQGEDNTFWLSRSTGTSFTAPAPILHLPGTYHAGQAQFADATGDGKPDLVFQTDDNTFLVSASGADYVLS